MDYEIEHVARAFYDVQDDAAIWEMEPEEVREQFRADARSAIALLEQHRERRLMDALASLAKMSLLESEDLSKAA